MSRILPVEDPSAVSAARDALLAGECVVIPTDTVYGVGASPELPGSTDRLFAIKRRPRDLMLPVLVASTTDAEAIALFDDRARGLAERFWPGPLTVILRRAETSRRWDLGAERGTVGVRVPAEETAVAILSGVGPVAVTSANRTGVPTAATCERVREALGEAVAVYVCAALPLRGRTSTIVDLSADEPKILREGGVPRAEILEALGGG